MNKLPLYQLLKAFLGYLLHIQIKIFLVIIFDNIYAMTEINYKIAKEHINIYIVYIIKF